MEGGRIFNLLRGDLDRKAEQPRDKEKLLGAQNGHYAVLCSFFFGFFEDCDDNYVTRLLAYRPHTNN